MKGVTCRDEPAENINHNQQSSWSILGTFSSVFWFHDSQRYSLSPSVATAGSCFKPEVSDKPTLHHLYGTKQTDECWKKNIKTFVCQQIVKKVLTLLCCWDIYWSCSPAIPVLSRSKAPGHTLKHQHFSGTTSSQHSRDKLPPTCFQYQFNRCLTYYTVYCSAQ